MVSMFVRLREEHLSACRGGRWRRWAVLLCLCSRKRLHVCMRACVRVQSVYTRSSWSSSVPSILICKCIIDGPEMCENVQLLKNLRHFTQLWLPRGRTGTSQSIYLNIQLSPGTASSAQSRNHTYCSHSFNSYSRVASFFIRRLSKEIGAPFRQAK